MTDTPTLPHEHTPHEHEHAHSPDDERGHNLSLQCWRAGQRARAAEDWLRAVELGRQAIELLPSSPEPRFNLAVALAGLAGASGQAEMHLAAAQVFDEGRRLVPEGGLVRYATEAVALLEKRAADFGGGPSYQYALGTHLAALGKLVRARRALESAAADPTLCDLAGAALAEVPEPQLPKAPPVGRNDPCPCGSGKKYKKCHGA
ncbi:MAG TPA: SEC-C metal-binding domain-containing protein [Chloroflexota bacterium]|jgi:hypothetical protein